MGYAAVLICIMRSKLLLVTLLLQQLSLLVLAHFLPTFLDHAAHVNSSLEFDSRSAQRYSTRP